MGATLRISLGVLFCYGIYCLVIFLFQRSLIFPRYGIDVPAQPADWKGLERWWLETESGKVEAWFLPPNEGDQHKKSPAVIFAHGNAEIVDYWPQELQGFVHMGMGVLLVEYPGYGRSDGLPSQKSITGAFLVAYDRLVARWDVDPNRIVLFGRSLGGGAICDLASKRPSAALILMSTFTSIQSFSWRFLVPPFLVLDPFDNLSVIKKYGGPVLVLHGREDTIIPYGHGKALAQAAKRGTLVSYECRHNNCPPDWAVFWEDVHAFFLDANIVPGRGDDNGESVGGGA